jgi:predicted transcriptional regulator
MDIVILRDEAILQKIDLIAKQENRSIEEIIKEALVEFLEKRQVDQELPREVPAFAGIIRSGEGDTAQRAEDILAEEWRPD